MNGMNYQLSRVTNVDELKVHINLAHIGTSVMSNSPLC